MKFIAGMMIGSLITVFTAIIIAEAKTYKLSQCEKTCNDQREKLKTINSDTTHKHCLKIGK